MNYQPVTSEAIEEAQATLDGENTGMTIAEATRIMNRMQEAYQAQRSQISDDEMDID